MKLLSKYIRINIILVIAIFILSSGALYFVVNRTIIHELDEELGDIRLNIERYVHSSQVIPQNSILYNYQLTSSPVKDTLEGARIFTVTKYIVSKGGTRNFRDYTFYVSVSGQFYQLTIEKQIEGMKIMARNTIKLSLITILFVICILMFVNRLAFNSIWKPFYQTLAIMRNFELNKQINLNFPKTDIEEFNYMNGILKSASQKAGEEYVALKEFTENASHELQTPLSIISSKLDLLIQDEKLSERHIQTLTGAYSALKKMAQLNQSLLLLAKIGNKQFSDSVKIIMDEKVKEKTVQFHELWQDQRFNIIEHIKPSVIFMNYDLNEILINNLFSNATRHNIQGGFIKMELEQTSFTISNSGLDEALDPQKIFKRFYKSDQSSASNGLGLSIIKQICDVSAIDIQYTFENSNHTFTLSWTNSELL